jgi:hypothetical protein
MPSISLVESNDDVLRTLGRLREVIILASLDGLGDDVRSMLDGDGGVDCRRCEESRGRGRGGDVADLR